jgi:hypothetical protein
MTPWLKSIDPRRVPLFAAAVLALGAAALALYVVLPQEKARRAALDEKAALAPSTAAAAALKAERAALEQTVRGLVAATSGPQAQLSRQALEAATIEDLQDIARRHDVELVAIAPRAGAEIGALEETTYEVELVGAYADTVKLLRDLRAELEPLVVRELTLTPRDDARDPALRARLVAATFGERR